MILSAVLSFLGGSAFRMIWGEVSAFVNKKKDHEHEMERMRLQAELDDAQHKRNLAAITLQAEMGIKTIEVQTKGAVEQLDASAFLEAVKDIGKATGIAWVDAWNAVIRPFGATWSLVMLTCHEFGWLAHPLSENTQMVAYAFLGLFVADRTLGKRGK